MKLLPYMVGMNFGEGQDGQLYVLGLLAPSNELACAHAVSTVMQMAKIEKPLTCIIWQELEEAFLVEALKGLRGETGGDTKVVSLRSVEPAPAPPTGDSVPSPFIACPMCPDIIRCEGDGHCYQGSIA